MIFFWKYGGKYDILIAVDPGKNGSRNGKSGDAIVWNDTES